jgi:predicted O-methyltransferase YrrM
MLRLPSLPASVSRLIHSFFDHPLKPDRQKRLHDIRLSSLRRSEAVTLARLVCAIRPEQCLEIGLAEGGSCVAISASRRECGLSASHTVLDPFQESLSGGAGLLELEKLGLTEAFRWQPVFSETFLLQHAQNSEACFDFVFVDGGHSIGQKLTDAFLLNKVLRPGGIVVFHDALLVSTATAVLYLVKECGYSMIALPPDGRVQRILRAARHICRLGPWYATHVIPNLCRSLVALQKPSGS